MISAQGCLPGSGGSSGAGLCAQCTARGAAEPGLASQSVSARFPLPSPVPEDSGHRLGERARRDTRLRAGAASVLSQRQPQG